ncbi:MAG: DUF3617 domain-containing protein [Deltaproteobacteria bacterium]|nr:DUF3617 domain-containing protein [Deltaproteobacteria bacterium]
MLRRLFVISAILVIAVSISFAGSGPDMQEGLWEITSKMKMRGMDMPSYTHTQCITKKDLVPQSSQPGQECQVTDVKYKGNTVTWNVKCSTQGGEMTGSGRITYGGDSFEGTMKMIMGGSGMEMTTYMSGRRIGDCK